MLAVILLVAALPDTFAGGKAAYERGDLSAAERLLDAAVSAEPGCGPCLRYRGLVADERRGGEGRPFYERALALDPRDQETLRWLGESLLAAGDLDAAKRAIDRAIALDPGYADPHYLLAEIAERRRDRPEAERQYRLHAALDPRSGAHHALGNLALDASDQRQARDEFAADLVAYPDCYEARINLAALELAAGHPVEAARHYRLSLDYHPDDPRAEGGLRAAGRARLLRGLAKVAAVLALGCAALIALRRRARRSAARA